jgi:hypothetical protein
MWFQFFAVTTMGFAAAPLAFLVLLYFPFLDLPKFGVNIDVRVKCDKYVQAKDEETESNSGSSAASEDETESKEDEHHGPYMQKYSQLMEAYDVIQNHVYHQEAPEGKEGEIQYPHIYDSIFAGVQLSLLARTHKLMDILENRQLTAEEELEFADVIESRNRMVNETKLAPSESSSPASDETHLAS